ncbi:hypothetical protein [Nocardia thailandica]
MTIEEFIKARLTERDVDQEKLTSALFHAEMRRRGNGPGCASFGSVWSRSTRTATELLATPANAHTLNAPDRAPVAAIWSDHQDFQPEWNTP